MNRRLFASRIAQETGHPVGALETILEAAIAALADELITAGRFEWRGLGTFVVRTYPSRKIHNPATGKTIELPARRSVTFKPSTQIRSRLKPPSARSRRTARASAR